MGLRANDERETPRKPIQMQFSLTLGSDVVGTLAEMIAQAVERGTVRHTQAIMEALGRVRLEPGESSAASVSVTPPASPTRSPAPEPKKEEPALIVSGRSKAARRAK